MININEALEMIGTEFVYVFNDGDEIEAYVKKFDPEVGLTCVSLVRETKYGFDDWMVIEEDGMVCVVGIRIEDSGDLSDALKVLAEIKQTGRYKKNSSWLFYTPPSCSFI